MCMLFKILSLVKILVKIFKHMCEYYIFFKKNPCNLSKFTHFHLYIHIFTGYPRQNTGNVSIQ